ncbi:hypothetical protein ACN6LC_000153 [Streptomyces violaceoruber]|uniref:Uncharacterized protein n=3 Tax=Streptomyces TaxID=1883 RepID=A0A7U9DT06_STRLI|nr:MULTISPECIES: hypothetical protein [Streptomyces]QSJ11268.1 hypothetical protein SLIVDG2_23850 [Streptomyces lividans]AIJ15691.1 hypothetical protein SLIV_23850 [Streptomyces lividans TK24]EFD69123.1 conserved hypothetical protein [Streptomyces lividans TK24]EOY47825.1 hypothetical protein SLI_3112 [Streptomyces lividans 1326]KKD13731.1 hypothetical protein TR66_19570 [Streptomyces sp. WM6391]
MPEQNESGHKLAGRLYATMRVLKSLTEPSGPKPVGDEELAGQDSPRERVQALKLDLFNDLVSTLQKGRHAKAVGEMFRAMPALVPRQSAAFDKNLGKRGLAEFNAGHRAQLAELKEAYPELIG